MRAREMHPLCCVSIESPGIGDRSALVRTGGSGFPSGSMLGSDKKVCKDAGSSVVAGVLYKWTNYGKGWRSRWFLLRNGVLSYSRIGGSDGVVSPSDEVQVIGDASVLPIRCSSRRKQQNRIGTVHLKVYSFRESKSDERRFYIFTATKTLHLRTDSRRDRLIWIEALVSAKNLFPISPLDDKISSVENEIHVSTKKLRDRLVKGGANEALIKDCEVIMLSQFSGLRGQLSLLCEERSNLLDTLRHFEQEASVEDETSGVHGTHFPLMKHEISSPAHGKYSECSTAESSEDIEKQELKDLSDADVSYFDTNDFFIDSADTMFMGEVTSCFTKSSSINCFDCDGRMHFGRAQASLDLPPIERRVKLPNPVEKEKGVSLWSMIKDNVGKDLTRVCLPVYFNEPISSLQKCFEDLEYSCLLDQAYEYGKKGNGLMRILNVAAFAVSGYASSEGRHCKPFNPLLGETYEADYPEKGIRFFSEKVSHHPMRIACHCEGKGWKFWGDSNIKSKFWGRSIQIDPVGILTLEFDDGEIFQWSKVTTTIYNLLLGKVYCDHHGTMSIGGNSQYSCKLKFKEQSILDRNPHQVHGYVEDVAGNKVATIMGKWDDSLYYVPSEFVGKTMDCSSEPDAFFLWKRNKPPPSLTRYNLSSFAITMNELTPGLQEKLPPTDSRLRPDQRYLENGEYKKADAEKLRLETRQRMSRKLQENGWKPRWFGNDSEDSSYRYLGGYWEAREQKNWDGCPHIFDEF